MARPGGKLKFKPGGIKMPDLTPPPAVDLDDKFIMKLNNGSEAVVSANELEKISELGRGAYGVVEKYVFCPEKQIWYADHEPGVRSRKSGFVINEEHVDDDEEENILADMDHLWAVLQANSEVEGTVAEYLTVDAQLETGGALTLAEIAEDVVNKDVELAEVASDSEIVEIEEEEPPATAREASQAMRILRSYADHVTNPAALKLFDQLDDYLSEERMKKLKQRTIVEYFAPNP